jgi:cytochrome c5
MSQEDKAFIKKFSGVIVGLMIFTILIIALAMSLQDAPDPSANPSQLENAKQRIAPVAGVRAGEEGAAELAAAPTPAAPAADSSAPVADAGAIDGAKVYSGLCQSCHQAGVAGAPVPGSAEMTQRADEKGLDGLVASAISGIGIMPARGGNSALSDAEIQAAVEYMLQP